MYDSLKIKSVLFYKLRVTPSNTYLYITIHKTLRINGIIQKPSSYSRRRSDMNYLQKIKIEMKTSIENEEIRIMTSKANQYYN